jgi:[methyl-Co(III) methanol-specific corrinoid protein]:coenzyme M methyltransferase
MQISPKKRVIKALVGGKLDRAPVTSIAGCGGAVNVEMQKATGIFWPDAHKNPEKMARLAIAGYELRGIECVKVPFGNIVEAEALGCTTRYPEKIHSYPVVLDHPYTKPTDLKVPDKVPELGRIPVVLEAIRIVREKVGDFLPLPRSEGADFPSCSSLRGPHRFRNVAQRQQAYSKMEERLNNVGLYPSDPVCFDSQRTREP